MPLPKEINPLTEDHLQILNEILGSCKNTEQLAQVCEDCGLDVAAVKERNRAQQDICTKIKANFFPQSI